jgi:hypothetical protein
MEKEERNRARLVVAGPEVEEAWEQVGVILRSGQMHKCEMKYKLPTSAHILAELAAAYVKALASEHLKLQERDALVKVVGPDGIPPTVAGLN